MMSKDYIEAKLKELRKEQRRWQTQSRHNPLPYVNEYLGVLNRRSQHMRIYCQRRSLSYTEARWKDGHRG